MEAVVDGLPFRGRLCGVPKSKDIGLGLGGCPLGLLHGMEVVGHRSGGLCPLQPEPGAAVGEGVTGRTVGVVGALAATGAGGGR